MPTVRPLMHQLEQLPQEVRTVLQLRAERVKLAPKDDEQAVTWVAEFPVGDTTYAMPLTALRAALPLKMVTPVPMSAAHVVGVLRFQGEILTALSLASLLGGRGWRQDPAVLLVVDPGWGRLTAFDCEQIPKPTSLPVSSIENARAVQSGAVLEITTPELRLVNYIDIAKLLDRRAAEARRG